MLHNTQSGIRHIHYCGHTELHKFVFANHFAASAADAQMFDIKNYDLQDLLDIDVNAYLNMVGEEAVIWAPEKKG